MVGIQIVSARIGSVSGAGLGTNIRKHYSKKLLYTIVGLLLFANIINIAADINAMASALTLIVGGPSHLYAVFFGLISVLLQVFIPYSIYVRFLKWLTLVLLAYVGTIFVIHIPWGQVIMKTFIPTLSWHPQYITTVVGIFGTTISPYLFFWQASQEVEEQELNPNAHPLIFAPEQVRENYNRIKTDTYIGMGFSNLVAFFIILTTAVTLHVHGLTNIQTSSDAALALKPIAGDFAFFLFSLGIIGTGLLAIPVLAGSSAYAIAETFDWKQKSLELRPLMAKRFYSVIIISTLIGVGLCFTKIDPIKALYMSAVVNGVISVPIMAIMMLMAVKPEIMGPLVIGKRLQILGWLTVICMAIAVIAMGVIN